jgi:hypothetical protein
VLGWSRHFNTIYVPTDGGTLVPPQIHKLGRLPLETLCEGVIISAANQTGGIKMIRIRKLLLVSTIPLLILVVALGSIGCAGEEATGGTTTPTPTTTPTVHENNIEYAIETFQRLPVEWERARYVNLAIFRQDANLKSFYDDIQGLVGQDFSTIGIELNKVEHVSFVIGHAAVYSGNLNLDDIKKALENLNYDRSIYLDAEIWGSPNPERGTVTLLPPNSVLVTNNQEDAELCISVIKGWGNSLYDNNGVKDVIARLPENPLRVDVSIGTESGLLATASSIEKTGSETMEMLTLSKFTDDASAQNGLPELAAAFNNRARIWNMVSVENVQIRSFIKSTGKAYIQDVKKADNLLGYLTYWLR